MEKNLNENSAIGLTSNLIISIVIIIVFFVILILVFKLFNYTSSKFSQNNIKIHTEDQSLLNNNNIMIPIITMEESNTNIVPAEQYSNSNSIIMSSPLTEENNKQIFMGEKTKQTYKKFEEITLPSSISYPNGYIGRDYICYRKKIGDQDFVSKRGGCMACQINNKDIDKTGNTHTNVVSSCVYSDKLDPNDMSIWTKEMCIDQCTKMPDVN